MRRWASEDPSSLNGKVGSYGSSCQWKSAYQKKILNTNLAPLIASLYVASSTNQDTRFISKFTPQYIDYNPQKKTIPATVTTDRIIWRGRPTLI